MPQSKVLKLSGIVHPQSIMENKHENPIFPTRKALEDIASSTNIKISLRNNHPKKNKDGKVPEVGHIDAFFINYKKQLQSDRIFVYDAQMQNDIITGKMKNLSVGIDNVVYPVMENGEKVIKKDTSELYEVSLTNTPAYPECKILSWEWVDGNFFFQKKIT